MERIGAVGALIDEYERSIKDLKLVISDVSYQNFIAILDNETEDPDCVSMQSILQHIVRSGYGYSNRIRKQFGKDAVTSKVHYEITSIEVAQTELDTMVKYTEETVSKLTDLTHEDIINNIMSTDYGQHYDFEQLLEHAIVHILRHRRQIEKFKLKHTSET
jgi:uncharacterized damage-inducible protein DinB